MKEDTKWRLRDIEGKEYIIIDSEKVDMQEELNKMITKQMKEIERLNNIINELEKDLYDNTERCKDNFNETQDIKWLDFIEIYKCIADKLQELKGSE